MHEMTSIRILEKDNNRRGDLFGRLMADLFVALGYEQPRLNIHKSGREVDLSAEHRLESRRAIAECKATADPIGGDDVNKFVGALDAERKGKTPVIGYFISLAGFKETAVEQERQGRRTKIITLTGQQVVSELVKGRILIAKDRATELAGRCCQALDDLALDPETELLAHDRGWIWAIYYTQGKARTHFVLIHSDGTPLVRVLAEEVITADSTCGGELHDLTCLNPSPPPDMTVQRHVVAAYGQYLTSECGYIQLDGLPADSDVGSRRLKLENLFVPLHLDISVKVKGGVKKIERQAVGAVLAVHSRLAILAPPGGGKSTLIKRLAVAYADSARHEEIADDLPRRNWLPLFFRCRELRSLARGSFADLLEALSQREPVRQYAEAFCVLVDRALLAGRVLLLVDGLDEISDPGDRAAFVCTLRTALQAYPGTAMVVTSREAGFRHVAAHLSPVCTHATLSPFDSEDIRRLSVAWHCEVVGDTEKVRADAEWLAKTIAENDRILRLAVNPLLLTTLLLVKRWVGSLPTRRAILYGKAVEVLLMTWNTEGHEPIPEEEALPQLCYVASAMMLEGVQKISRPCLATLLQEARDALPTELGYVKGTVDQFIHRVEDRSSLLMMTGHDVEDGRLVEFFEFRHLTFQEFLTARAMVKGWHLGRREEDSLVSVLEPHFQKEEWREVIPLAAVLGGKETESLLRRLTEELNKLDHDDYSGFPVFRVLCSCLADEAAARPETIRRALRELVRLGNLFWSDSWSALFQGRYGADLRDEARRAFLSATPDLANPGSALLWAVWWQTLEAGYDSGLRSVAERFVGLVNESGVIARCEGALGIGLFSRRSKSELTEYAECLRGAGPALVSMLDGLPAERFSSSFAIAQLGEGGVRIMPAEIKIFESFFRLWRYSTDKTMRTLAVEALVALPLASRDDNRQQISIPREELGSILQKYIDFENHEKTTILVAAWYLRALTDTELVRHIRALLKKDLGDAVVHTLRELLERLGRKP